MGSLTFIAFLFLHSVHHLHHHSQAHGQAQTPPHRSAHSLRNPYAGPAHARQLPGQTILPQPPPQPPPKPSVVVVIPTIARKGNQTYLHQTLASMQHHGFSMDAVYVMKSNDAPHPVYDASLREFQFRKVEPPNVPVNIQYTPNPARLDDSQVQVAFADSPHQKTWRISEARDWRYLMEYILKTTKAKFIIFNQDDGEWITQFSLQRTQLRIGGLEAWFRLPLSVQLCASFWTGLKIAGKKNLLIGHSTISQGSLATRFPTWWELCDILDK